MGKLLVRCPKTGQAIFTGRYVDSATFRSTPVFFSPNYCPLCHAMHEWFAKDAWICDSEYPTSICQNRHFFECGAWRCRIRTADNFNSSGSTISNR